MKETAQTQPDGAEAGEKKDGKKECRFTKDEAVVIIFGLQPKPQQRGQAPGILPETYAEICEHIPDRFIEMAVRNLPVKIEDRKGSTFEHIMNILKKMGKSP